VYAGAQVNLNENNNTAVTFLILPEFFRHKILSE
jgi:hypothetical protein